MRSGTGFFWAAWIVAAGFFGTGAAAELIRNGPPETEGPVVVRATFDLRDLNQIDDEAEVFEFEGVLVLEWHDERQAFDPGVAGVKEKFFQGAYQFNEVYDGWFPQVVLVNESGLFEKHGTLLRVKPDGSLRLVETMNAAAKTDLDLRAHPFDHQRLEALFEVLGFDESEVVLEAVPLEVDAATAEISAIRLPQWALASFTISTTSRPAPHAGDGGSASTLVVELDVERESLFIIRLVIVPLLLIVMLSWSVFWMEQSSLGDRTSVSFIGILTVVSYQIILSESLPRISYLTLMNGFLNMTFFVMCASVVINLWVGWLDRRGETERGDRIDRRCRWIFPLVYTALLALVGGLTVGIVT